MRRDFGAGDLQWVAVHLARQGVAGRFEERGEVRGVAVVLTVAVCRFDHFGDDVCAGLQGFLVDVALNCSVEAVEHVGAGGEEEEVKGQLGVEGEDVGDGWVGGDESEEGRYETLFRLGGMLLLLLTVRLVAWCFAVVCAAFARAYCWDCDFRFVGFLSIGRVAILSLEFDRALAPLPHDASVLVLRCVGSSDLAASRTVP